ncbi:hypothetical protein KR054_005704 [Drosophila jambulina]|nr:hypothetical protein KR054_005704 [Drosophila jambulina]
MVEFSNLKCETMDKDFADFEYCYLRSVNRTYKYMTIKVRLFQVSITKAKVNFALYQRLNGLKPFLYNVTIDGCKFLKNPKSNMVVSYFYDFIKNNSKFLKNPKSNMVVSYFYDFIKNNSNLNHPCPYDVSTRYTFKSRIIELSDLMELFQHDLYLYKVSTQYIDYRITAMLPFLEGRYMFKTDWFVYGIKRAVVSVYLTLS